MKSKYIILLLLIMLMIVPVLAASQTVSFTQDGTWTCPSDVNSVSIKMIGGGAGGIGGYAWYKYSSGYYGWGNGVGGAAGTYITQSNIPVTPGQSYNIIVGTPGIGVAGIFMFDTSTTVYRYGNPGSASTAFGYTANGGVASTIFWIDDFGYLAVTPSHGSTGSNGYGSYQIAAYGANGLSGYGGTGDPLYTSYGSPAGLGYGAGGGGGGAGGIINSSAISITGGSGGNGAYGYVEITYDSASTNVVLTGYVVDAYTSSVISGAVVNATQSGVIYSATSAVDGSFTINSASLTYGLPIVVVTNKSTYADDVNTFTPLASGPINLTIPMIPLSYYTNTTIVGIVRDSLYGNPISSATYYAQDTTTSVISTATSNTRGLAIVTGLTSDHFYYVWANKTGYSSPSPVLVKPYS